MNWWQGLIAASVIVILSGLLLVLAGYLMGERSGE